MMDDLNDVEDIVDEGDVYCTIVSRKNAVRVRALNYACLGCSIRIEKRQGRSGGCCGDGNNYYTTQRTKFHDHLDSHKFRGEVVPAIYYEMQIQ
jgi:hypothetical protein